MEESTLLMICIGLDVLGLVSCWTAATLYQDTSRTISFICRLFSHFFIIGSILDFSHVMWEGCFSAPVEMALNNGVSGNVVAFKLAIIVSVVGMLVREKISIDAIEDLVVHKE